MFSMCLGKNGGYFQIGGYDKTGHIDNQDVTWLKMTQKNADYKVPFHGIKMNNHLMSETSSQTVAFVDSGTTFTYVN